MRRSKPRGETYSAKKKRKVHKKGHFVTARDRRHGGGKEVEYDKKEGGRLAILNTLNKHQLLKSGEREKIVNGKKRKERRA